MLTDRAYMGYTLAFAYQSVLDFTVGPRSLSTPPGTAEAEAWVVARLTTILHGQAARAVAEITAQAAPGRLLDQLGYDTALAVGWPIAAGGIEGACRHLIGDRSETRSTWLPL
jgi:hypothetical protein